MVEKIGHYSLETHATIYDEEALTALQLAGRTAAKVNECVDEVNRIPEVVSEENQRLLDNGTFDRQIDKMAGDLSKQLSDAEASFVKRMDDAEDSFTDRMSETESEFTEQIAAATAAMTSAEGRMSTQYSNLETALTARVDNLVKAPSGSTSMDTEVLDIRVDNDGKTYTTAGAAVRGQVYDLNNIMASCMYVGANKTARFTPASGGALKVFFPTAPYLRWGYGQGLVNWETASVDITDRITINADGSAEITIGNGCQLLYNTNTKKFIHKGCSSKITPYDIVLVKNSYSTALGGKIVEELIFNNTFAMYKLHGSYMYLGKDDDIKFTVNKDDGCLDVYMTACPYIRCETGSVALTWDSTHTSEIADRLVLDGNGGATISLDTYEVLGANFHTKKFFIKSHTKLEQGDIVGLTTSHWYPAGGSLLVEYSAKRAMETAEKDVVVPDAKLQTFARKFNNTVKTDSFLFFTDPHTGGRGNMNGWEAGCKRMLDELEGVYKSAPFDFCLAGGDWLNNSDTPEMAFYKLSYIAGQTKSRFKTMHHMLGNHDTNYQGTVQLPNEVIANMLFREEGRTYYHFTTPNTTYFVFDCGLDWSHEAMNEYDWTQLEWFKAERKKVKTANIVILSHMYYVSESMNVHPLINAVMGESYAHNTSGAPGKVRYCLSGHMHKDITTTNNGIPVVMTKNAGSNGTCADMVVADYQNNKLHLVRYGDGDDRTIEL